MLLLQGETTCHYLLGGILRSKGVPKEMVSPRPQLPAATQNLPSSFSGLGTECRNCLLREWEIAGITSQDPGKVQNTLESLTHSRGSPHLPLASICCTSVLISTPEPLDLCPFTHCPLLCFLLVYFITVNLYSTHKVRVCLPTDNPPLLPESGLCLPGLGLKMLDS